MFVNGITDCSNFRAKVVRKEHLRKLWLGGGGGGGGGEGCRQTEEGKHSHLPHQPSCHSEQFLPCFSRCYLGTVKPGLGLSHKLDDLDPNPVVLR